MKPPEILSQPKQTVSQKHNSDFILPPGSLSTSHTTTPLCRAFPPSTSFAFAICCTESSLSSSPFFFFSFFGHVTRHVGSQFPTHRLNPHSLHWKQRVLTTRLPGKSQFLFFSCLLLFLQVSAQMSSPQKGVPGHAL